MASTKRHKYMQFPGGTNLLSNPLHTFYVKCLLLVARECIEGVIGRV